MRFLATILLAACCVVPLRGQTPAASVPELDIALAGDWTGVLEYRDYSEPPASTKRVKLPTWLNVTVDGASLRLRYVYDDGPGKTVISTERVTLDPKRSLWTAVTESKTGESPRTNAVDGLDKLKNGSGTLVLTGSGLENGQPVDLRTTVRIGRNLLEMLRESRRPGAEFSFRDSYTLVRALAPGPK